MLSADHWIKKLNLEAHPEGGYFRETYRSKQVFEEHNLTTGIYFLLEGRQKSRFHSLTSDELWYYHLGSSIKIYLIDQKGALTHQILGPHIDQGESLSLLIPAGVIFGAELMDKEGFGLVSCIVSPGFRFEDFKLYNETELVSQYPEHSQIIKKFT